MKKLSALIISSVLAVVSVSAAAGDYYRYYQKEKTYEITVTNITKGQSFTPIVATSHTRSIALFDLGAPALPELATLAESGNIAPLADLLATLPELAGNNAATEGLLLPGASITLTLSSSREFPLLSMAAMLIPTNDTFFAVDSVRFPKRGTKVIYAQAYDAGSELNDELCANIPGPACGGTGPSPEEDGEGYVHISAGVHGEADLKASAYDWRGAVARVEVTRIR